VKSINYYWPYFGDNDGPKHSVCVIWESYQFDESGKVTVILTYDGNQISWSDSLFYKTDRLDEERNYDYGKFKRKDKLFYNEKGQLAEKQFYKKKNKLKSRKVYQYNLNGELITVNGYRPNGKPTWKETNLWDGRGNLIEHRAYSRRKGKSLTMHKRVVKSYNNKNQVIEFREFKHNYYKRVDSLELYKIYRYSYEGNKVERTDVFTHDYQLLEIWYFKYDTLGNEIEKIIHNNEGREPLTEKIIYLYDSQNNWIKRSKYSNDYLSEREKREIEYYE
jgi:hypothetical protein